MKKSKTDSAGDAYVMKQLGKSVVTWSARRSAAGSTLLRRRFTGEPTAQHDAGRGLRRGRPAVSGWRRASTLTKAYSISDANTNSRHSIIQTSTALTGSQTYKNIYAKVIFQPLAPTPPLGRSR